MPLLSNIAARTKKIRIGAGVSVLPLREPISLAEESAMLDVLCNGRLDFGVGRGSADYEYGNFNVAFDSRDVRTQEALDVILGLWTQDGLQPTQGEFYEVKGLTIAPKPVAEAPSPGVHGGVPHPRQRGCCGRAGPAHPDQLFHPGGRQPGTLLAVRGTAAPPLGKDLPVADMPYFRFVYLEEDGKAAREYPRESITWVRDLAGYRRTLTHGDEINMDLDHWRQHSHNAEPVNYESELETTTYFGTPEECVERITKLRDEHGIGYFRGEHVLRQHGALAGDALHGAVRQRGDAEVPGIEPRRQKLREEVRNGR